MSMTSLVPAVWARGSPDARPGFTWHATRLESACAWTGFLGSLPVSLALLYRLDRDDPAPVVAYGLAMTLLLGLSIVSLESLRRRAIESARGMTTELHDSAVRYRAIVDTAADAIVIVDQTGTICFFNAAAERIFGYTAAEAVGRCIGLLMPEPVRRSHEAIIAMYRPCGCPFIGTARTTEGRRKDGSIFPLDLSVAETVDGNGLLWFTTIMRDVSRRQEAQEALRLAKERAEEAARIEHELWEKVQAANRDLKGANDSLTKFTAIAAHDLRAPLRRVEAFVNVLRVDHGPSVGEDGNDILCRIERGTKRMRVMLDALLDYSKSGAEAIRGKTADLARVIEDTIEQVDLRVAEVELRVELLDVSHVRGDPVLLGHVFQNLIGNAIKFRGGSSPVVDIHVERADTVVTVTVTDNGIGIEPQFAERVFDLFCRLHDEDEYEGCGIGLSVCRKIVHDHGGRIWVDTDYVGGARVLFTLESADAADRPSDRIDAVGAAA